MIDFRDKVVLVSGTVVHADGGALAAAGWYRDNQGTWTNMPVITGNSLKPAEGTGSNPDRKPVRVLR